MTATFITTDTIGSGVGHTWGSTGDSLYVAQDTILASTGNVAFSTMSLDSLSVRIQGTVISQNYMLYSGDNILFHVASGGSFEHIGHGTGGNWGIGATSTVVGARIIIDGSFGALSTIGIGAAGGTDIVVRGEVNAGTNAIFLGLFGNEGDSLVNSGTISGGLRDIRDVRTDDSRYSSGVLVEGDDARITNLQGGVIVTYAEDGVQADGPGAIEYQGNVSGAVLRNYGEVISVNGYGIDMDGTSGVTGSSFMNFGTVQGPLGSLRASDYADTFHNRGLMDGDVDMGTGNDTFDNRAGDVDGDVLLGAGDDFYDGRLDAYVTGAILGGDGDDVIYGGHNADLIEGGENNDELRGNGGNDEIRGDNGDDMMLGNDGDDELIGGNGNDSLFGGRGNDVLNGGNDNDRINGGDGDDRIIAGGGTDILFGDGGADTFTFASVNDSGMTGATRDRIFDFDQAEGDVVFLASIDANDNVGGNQVFSYIAGASFSNTAGELRYTSSGMIEGDTDGDGSADFQILLTTAPTLTVDAFVL